MLKFLLISLLLFCTTVASANQVDDHEQSLATEENTKYELNSEKWSVNLLLDTCKRELNKAVKEALSDLDSKKLVVLLPEAISYKYFKVKIRTKTGILVSPVDEYEYEFQYWTDEDEHLNCNRVEPMGFIY